MIGHLLIAAVPYVFFGVMIGGLLGRPFSVWGIIGIFIGGLFVYAWIKGSGEDGWTPANAAQGVGLLVGGVLGRLPWPFARPKAPPTEKEEVTREV